MSRSRAGGLWLALVLTSTLHPDLVFAQRAPSRIPQVPALMPDAAQAQVGGRTAIGLWASRGGRVLDPQGYTAHFVDDSRLEEELVLPAGHWLVPPRGTYKIWIEGNGFISPTFALLRYSGGPFRGRGFASTNEVVEAGQVRLAPDLRLRPGESVRVLRIGPRFAEGVDRGFMRAITADGERAVLMPSGRAVALLFDRGKEQYIAASAPFGVPTNGSVVVPALRPPRDSVVFAVLRRHESSQTAEEGLSVTLTGTGDAGGRPADVLIETWEWIYALWYGITDARVKIHVASATGVLPAEEVDLPSGQVTTVRGQMQPPLDLGTSPSER